MLRARCRNSMVDERRGVGIITTFDQPGHTDELSYGDEPACSDESPCRDDLASVVGRICAGDDRALSELHSKMAAKLQYAAKCLVGSNECAQEVVADVFLHVWKHAGSYDASRGSVKTWLYGITHNRAIDRWRRNRRHPLLNAQLLLERVQDLMSPEQLLDRLQECRSVHAALATLSPVRQQLLALSFFDGLSHEEISLNSGMPLGTVKSHLRRALHAMRDSFPRKAGRPAVRRRKAVVIETAAISALG